MITAPVMVIRETPEKPWKHCAVVIKNPTVSKYFFHDLTDIYSHWAVVEMKKISIIS